MDYADGGDLRREIVKARNTKNPITEEMITIWMIQVLYSRPHISLPLTLCPSFSPSSSPSSSPTHAYTPTHARTHTHTHTHVIRTTSFCEHGCADAQCFDSWCDPDMLPSAMNLISFALRLDRFAKLWTMHTKSTSFIGTSSLPTYFSWMTARRSRWGILGYQR
jgi:hypothetical protein